METGADINATEENGFTVLRNAIWSDSYDIAEYLLSKGASIDNQNDVLISAVISRYPFDNQLKTLDFLLATGFDINAQYDHGRTLLFNAANRNQVELCQYLLSLGADMNIKDRLSNLTAKEYAEKYGEKDTTRLFE